MTLIDTADIAALLHMTREYVTDRLTKRPDFPKPVVNLSRKTRRWDRQAVLDFVAQPSESRVVEMAQ